MKGALSVGFVDTLPNRSFDIYVQRQDAASRRMGSKSRDTHVN